MHMHFAHCVHLIAAVAAAFSLKGSQHIWKVTKYSSEAVMVHFVEGICICTWMKCVTRALCASACMHLHCSRRDEHSFMICTQSPAF